MAGGGDMIHSPHLGIKCLCGQLAAVPIASDQMDQEPERVFRSLPAKERRELAQFWAAHEAHGELVPCVVDIQSTEKA